MSRNHYVLFEIASKYWILDPLLTMIVTPFLLRLKISLFIWSEVKWFSRVRLFATPWAVAHQAPWSMGFPGMNTGVGCHFLLQGIFRTQVSNPGLPHCRQTLYSLSYQGSSVYVTSSNHMSKYIKRFSKTYHASLIVLIQKPDKEIAYHKSKNN